MTNDEAVELSKRVVRDSTTRVYVKRGKTNGRECLHIVDRDPADASRSATTIYGEAEWDLHPLNKSFKAPRVVAGNTEEGDEGESYPKQQSVRTSALTPAMAERLAASATRPVVSPDA